MKNKNILRMLLISCCVYTAQAFAAGAGVNAAFNLSATVPYTYQLACAGAATCNPTIDFGTLTPTALGAGVTIIQAATVYTNNIATSGGVTFSLNPTGGSFAMPSTTAGVVSTIPYTVTYTDCAGTTSSNLTASQAVWLAPSASATVMTGGSVPCSKYLDATNQNIAELRRGNFTFKIPAYTSNYPQGGVYAQSIKVDICDGNSPACIN